MFDRLLIANRGEIAIRVIRACQDLGITTIAVYSDADRDALHVRLADEAYHLGADAPSESYLNIPKILEVAKASGAQAVHPGYGFLSENADFVRACDAAGIVFVGPPADAMDQMGDKISARKAAEIAKAPFVPGTMEPVTDVAEVHAFGAEHGYPIAIKAAFGGGGRGFKVINREEDIEDAVSGAQREAKLAFGRDEIYIERYLRNARHVEAQILADNHGTVLFMGERDCSIQRRHQKLVEESPCPVLSDAVRAELAAVSVKIAKQVDYTNAGTVEFLLDEDHTRFYFMEMNTRLQVEHPVTELVTGVDLAVWQIRVAAGERLPWKQEEIRAHGHAIEVRINAEDPSKGRFLPAPGRIGAYREPSGPGVRVDSGFIANSDIPRSYDSMIAKLITWGADRDEARRRMIRALNEYQIEGVKTVIPFHHAMMTDPRFIAGDIHTAYVEAEMDLSGLAHPPVTKVTADAPAEAQEIAVEVDGKRIGVTIFGGLAAPAAKRQSAAKPGAPSSGGGGVVVNADGETVVEAPMQGTLVKIAVAVGDSVAEGDLIAVLEAMKMENHINAPRSGVVKKLLAEVGQNIDGGAPVAMIG